MRGQCLDQGAFEKCNHGGDIRKRTKEEGWRKRSGAARRGGKNLLPLPGHFSSFLLLLLSLLALWPSPPPRMPGGARVVRAEVNASAGDAAANWRAAHGDRAGAVDRGRTRAVFKARRSSRSFARALFAIGRENAARSRNAHAPLPTRPSQGDPYAELTSPARSWRARCSRRNSRCSRRRWAMRCSSWC